MPDLSDLRLRWDSFWSKYYATHQEADQLYQAKFAHLYQVAPLLEKQPQTPGLLLGIGPYNRPIRVRPTATKPQLGNVLDIGPSQCGKSTRAIGEILDFAGSVVVNDIKGELREKTAGFRRLLGKGKVFTVAIGGGGNRFDPLDGRVTEQQLFDSAFHLIYRPNEKDTYWQFRATRMLTQLFLAARRRGERPLPFTAKLIRLGLNDAAATLHAIAPDLSRAFLEEDYSPFTNFQENRRSLADAWTTVTTYLYPVLTDSVLPSLSGSDFTARDVLFSEEPVTVYFCWPEEDLRSLMPLIRLVWEALVYDLKQTARRFPHLVRQKVLLELDEAGITGLSGLPEDVATLNGRGVSVSLSAQDLEQFKAQYGEHRARSLLNNMESKIIHRQASYDTIRYFQLLMDYTSGFAHSDNTHGDTQSTGRSEREIPLLSVRQFQELDDTDVIILHRNIPPIWARRLSVQKLPELAKRARIAPPPLPALPAPIHHSRFPLWDRQLVGPGHYRLAYRALGYPIPLPAG